jgi:hypothetical protein
MKKIKVGMLIRRKQSAHLHTGLLAEVVALSPKRPTIFARVRLLEGENKGHVCSWNLKYFNVEQQEPDWEI